MYSVIEYGDDGRRIVGLSSCFSSTPSNLCSLVSAVTDLGASTVPLYKLNLLPPLLASQHAVITYSVMIDRVLN